MNDYYSKKLSANNLRRCYEIASPRVQQYLEAELNFAQDQIQESDIVIELGCGYGRALRRLLHSASKIIGIDTSLESLQLAAGYTEHDPRCHLFQASAEKLALPDNSIDKVVCIQNGISAFKLNPLELVKESVRITRKGGQCLFSSYSDKFWIERIDWFKMQADANLIGDIDWQQTADGIISCKDGFRATTFREEDFTNVTSQLGLEARILEIDRSSVFCVIAV